VHSYDDLKTAGMVTRLAKELCTTVQYEGYFPTDEFTYIYKYRQPLVKPDQLPHLQTQMRKLHDWYMQACKEGNIMLIVGIREEHYFRGNEEIHIEFEELFQLFNQEALNKTLMSCYCL
jgi:hypothetical protein